MRNPVRTSRFVTSVASVCLALVIPVTTLAAGGTTTAAPAAQPHPDRETKVWMNEDVVRLNPAFGEISASKRSAPPVAASALPIAAARPVAPALRPVTAVAPLDPQQDPRWYAEQIDALDAELAGVESRERQLSQFRATGTGLPVGLVLDAPCEGIATDNLIAQLDAHREEVLQQIDALGDTARRNELPPGILVEGRGRLQRLTRGSGDLDRPAAHPHRVVPPACQ